MNKSMMAFCGAYCGVCEWKDKMNCAGCQSCHGDMFYGQCGLAKCCMERGLPHCGACLDVPCQSLLDLFADPEHGDGGARLRNLQNWANGIFTYEKLGNVAQEEAKNAVIIS